MISDIVKSYFQKKSFVSFLYVIVSIYVFLVWILSANTLYTSFNGDPDSKLSDLIKGTAHKPYVNRMLVPFLTRTLHSTISESSWESFEKSLLTIPIIEKETERLGWEQEFLSEYIIALFFVLTALIIFPFVVRGLWNYFYETDIHISNTIPIIVLLILPTLFWTGPHYIYDFPALLLFTLGLFLLLKQRWIYFYIIFILGCFNKETMVFLTPLYFILFREKDSKSKVITNLVSQVVIFVIIRLMLLNVFKENPGEILSTHLNVNIRIILKDYSWGFLFVFSGTIGLIFYDWKNKPEQLRQCFMIVIQLLIIVFFLGIITELRAVYEIIPIILFLMFHTVLFTILKLPYRIKYLNN